MKKLLIASAIALAASTAAYAQGDTSSSTARPDATSTTGSIPNARMEVIRNYWQTERPRAVVLPQGVVISRGAVVPSTVELHTFPENVGTPYRYVVVGNSMYLVDPSDRRVVQVIE